MRKKNPAAAIADILNNVEALMPLANKGRNDRGARLRQAESEAFQASVRSDRPIHRAARLANAERAVAQEAKKAVSAIAARELRNRYNLWRA